MDTLLNIEDVHFSYADRKILKGVSFSLQQGEIVSLLGLSGSGKTTLFRLITGLISPERGEISIQGHPLDKVSSPFVTYMRQEDLLLPWRTVLKNLLLCGELGKKKGLFNEVQALEMLEKVGLPKCAHFYPFQLSGGMRQRVSLARALLQNRPLLLLDEPFGSLDVIIREQLYVLLRAIRCQLNKTLLFVTHDFRDAIALSDRILLLTDGMITQEFLISDSTRSNPLEHEELIRSIRLALANSSESLAIHE